MTRPRLQNARERDEREFNTTKPPLTQYLQHAVIASGRNPLSMAREYLKLPRGRGRVTLQEYVQFAMYKASFNDDDRSRFLSEALHWPITRACCDMTWQATTEDKWLCAQILGVAGLPVPPTLAVIDKADRTFPGTRTLRSAPQLGDLVYSHCRDERSLFCKPNCGIASFGTFIVTEAEPSRLYVDGEGWMDYDACLHEFVGNETYLLQPLQRNHPLVGRYTDRLATVRVYVLRSDAGVKLPFAILKMAAPEHSADNFWRPGNLACDIDPATGVIRRARTKDLFGTTDHAEHPGSGIPLVGQTLPLWDQVVALVLESSSIFAPIRYQSMDIAIQKDGPVVIEINTGGAFNLPQLATGQGFLTDEVLEFLRARGWKGSNA